MSSSPKTKHIPQRTCIACKSTGEKRELVRLVRTAAGNVEVDPTGKRAGRGAYLCRNAACWEKALQRTSLGRALKTELSPEDRDALLRHSRLLVSEFNTQPAPEAEGETSS